MMASVFKYDSRASFITLYPLACTQKGIDPPRMCAGLTVGFIVDAGTL
jgi:hypothetical protein